LKTNFCLWYKPWK